MNNLRNNIIEWLRKLPPDDPRGYQPKEDFSYEKWFQIGKSFPDITKQLIDLLEEIDINKPTDLTFPIVYALGWIGDLSAANLLSKFMQSPSEFIRYESIASLGRLKALEYFDSIRKILEDRKQTENVRANACIALGNMGHPDSKRVLQNFINDSNPFVAKCADVALGLLK
ncbi:MAG: hypothetical protein HYY40_11910 [Bacteroidetes bacterium]|nr:hypothetical protein [Bacteroidota bacterium]